MKPLPGTPDSCWTASAPRTGYPSLEESHRTETVIVGAGIVGLTAALALSQAGRPVIVMDGRRVGGQVTGRSTAKITTQHALIYRHLIDTLGMDKAKAYAAANGAGVRQIVSWTQEHGISCDLEGRAAYAYSCDEGRLKDLEAEAEAARQAGLRADVLERAPLPFNTSGALCFPGQYQFNPASYLVGLSKAVEAAGGRIFENSRARSIEEGNRWHVESDQGTVEAENVVVATNITVKSPVGYANRTQPRCHVAMAFHADDPDLIDGMFISVDDPTHSLRMGRDDDGPLLIALGPRFNTGHDGDVATRFRDLDVWVRERLSVGEARWRWCNEDYDTPDRVPYAGEPAPGKSPGFYVATGFNAWGISNGTATGLMIADRIRGRESPWSGLYDATRPGPDDFNAGGESKSIVSDVGRIPPGGGGVLVRGEERFAVCREEDGRLHVLSASCTHKGCTVTWNNADRTWDCPCHGSVFEANGSVLHGPARKALAPAEL